MKDIRCMLGRHKFSEWIEVGNHLERECLRCPQVEAKYPELSTVLAGLAADMLWKYYVKKNPTPKIVNSTAVFCEKEDTP